MKPISIDEMAHSSHIDRCRDARSTSTQGDGAVQSRRRRVRAGAARGIPAVVYVVFVLFLFQLGCQSEEERAAALTAEITKLEDRVAKATAARALLDDVDIVDSQFLGRVENRPGTAELRLTINNKTEHRIQRIQFEAVLAMPGSSNPLLKGKIDSNTAGGLEPGKSVSLKLFPMQDSPWETYDPPEGAVLRLTPTRLVGVAGTVLAEARSPERQANDEASLASLRAELQEIQPRSH